MPEIRRDKKGRKLKDGETQRKDGRYQYRYTDVTGERRYLYDFENNVVIVDKQLLRLKGGMKITSLKSEAGYRKIPMVDEVRESFRNLIERRKTVKTNVMIDGHVGFLSVTRNGRPRGHSEYADAMRLLMERYNEQTTVPIERCTPHTLRHTFCTKCVAAGMDIKTVQYLMGHFDASTMLNIYADVVEDKVSPNMESLRIVRYGT